MQTLAVPFHSAIVTANPVSLFYSLQQNKQKNQDCESDGSVHINRKASSHLKLLYSKYLSRIFSKVFQVSKFAVNLQVNPLKQLIYAYRKRSGLSLLNRHTRIK